MFLVLLYLVGGGLGSLLAVGTCWTAAKRYVHRSVALAMAQPLALTPGSAQVLASHHAGRDKAEWLAGILRNKKKTATTATTTLLDVCGATHGDLIETLLLAPQQQQQEEDEDSQQHHNEWEIEVFDSQPAIAHLMSNPSVLPWLQSSPPPLVLTTGSSLDQLAQQQQQPVKRYDLVLVADNIVHSLPPHKRLACFQKWTAQLLHPLTGHLAVLAEIDPLSETAEAGIIQSVFHRVSVGQLRLLLESSGLAHCETHYFGNLVCITARKHVDTIEQHQQQQQQQHQQQQHAEEDSAWRHQQDN